MCGFLSDSSKYQKITIPIAHENKVKDVAARDKV